MTRAKIVTHRGSSSYVTTEVKRDIYDAFETIAHREGLTKAAKLRQLVEECVRKQEPVSA